MPVLPDYWLPRPPLNLDRQACAHFDRLIESITAAARTSSEPRPPRIPYTAPAPLWQFLCYVADQHAFLLHGSGDPNIATFEPRQPVDLSSFGSQSAVYAAGDGIWAMFYAIIDRQRYPLSINNACIRIAEQPGVFGAPFYLFSISQTALVQQPWRSGSVYLLPADPFTAQPVQQFGPYELRVPQYACPTHVVPLARFDVTPADFPFLSDIRGHDDAHLQAYVDAMQTGGPWPDLV